MPSIISGVALIGPPAVMVYIQPRLSDLTFASVTLLSGLKRRPE